MDIAELNKIAETVWELHGRRFSAWEWPVGTEETTNYTGVEPGRTSWCERIDNKLIGEFAGHYRWLGLPGQDSGLDRLATALRNGMIGFGKEKALDFNHGAKNRKSIHLFLTLAAMKSNFIEVAAETQDGARKATALFEEAQNGFEWGDDRVFIPRVEAPYQPQRTAATVEEYVAACTAYAARAANTHILLVATHTPGSWHFTTESEFCFQLSEKIPQTWLKENMLNGRFAQRSGWLYLTDERDAAIVRLAFDGKIKTFHRDPSMACGGTAERPTILPSFDR